MTRPPGGRSPRRYPGHDPRSRQYAAAAVRRPDGEPNPRRSARAGWRVGRAAMDIADRIDAAPGGRVAGAGDRSIMPIPLPVANRSTQEPACRAGEANPQMACQIRLLRLRCGSPTPGAAAACPVRAPSATPQLDPVAAASVRRTGHVILARELLPVLPHPPVRHRLIRAGAQLRHPGRCRGRAWSAVQRSCPAPSAARSRSRRRRA